MTMSKYDEQLFESMKIIAEKCVKAINYDATKQAVIVDDTGKKQGWYQIKLDDSVTCKAHPIDQNTEYNTGDKVVVLIPNNDINEQKIILSKWADEIANSYVYESPMDSMVDVTGNLVLGTELSNAGVVANDHKGDELGPFDNARNNSAAIGSYRHLGAIKNDNFPLIGYNILGVKANFKTLLSQCVQGDYGLRLRVTCAPPQETAQYNGALDAFERLKIACLKFVNLYMQANKNGGTTNNAHRLFARASSEQDSVVNNKLYVTIYRAYLEILTAFSDLEDCVDWTQSILDGGIVSDLDTSIIYYLHRLNAENEVNDWLKNLLYKLENQITDLDTAEEVTHTYYTSAAVLTDWAYNVDKIEAQSATASREQLDLAWLNCYNWILFTCSDYLEFENNQIIYKDNIAPLTAADFQYCNLSNLNTFLLKNNKVTKVGSASASIDTTGTDNLLKNVIIVNMYLTTKEMVGAIYNCPDGYIQEAIFPIENLGAIYQIDIDLYEQPQSFYYYNSDGELTPYPYLLEDAGLLESSAIQDILIEDAWGTGIAEGYTPQDEGQRIADNIFATDLYICGGYKKDYYNEEQAILYTRNSDTYSKDIVDLKQISVRWVHQNEETKKFDVMKLADFDDTKYKIQWYQQDIACIGDNWSGAKWKHLSEYDNSFSCEFFPRVNDYQNELIKCIILSGHMDNETFVADKIIVRSNILTFTNEINLAEEKLTEVNLDTGLNLVCSDGSNGMYFIYDEMFTTTDKSIAEPQKLNLVLNRQAADTAIDINELPLIDSVQFIQWTIPLRNSMLTFYWDNLQLTTSLDLAEAMANFTDYTFTYLYATEEENAPINAINIISKQAVSGAALQNHLKYKIRSQYNPDYVNNIVLCSIQLPNETVTLSTKLQFMFGSAFTNGYPYTLLAIPTDTENVGLVITNNENAETLMFKVRCFDNQNHKELTNFTIETAHFKEFIKTENHTSVYIDNNTSLITISYLSNEISIVNSHILYIAVMIGELQLSQEIPISISSSSIYADKYFFNPIKYLYYNSVGTLNYKPTIAYQYTGTGMVGFFALYTVYKTTNNNNTIYHQCFYTADTLPEAIVLDTEIAANAEYHCHVHALDSANGTVKNKIFYPQNTYTESNQLNIGYFIISANTNYPSIRWACPIIKQQYRYPYASVNNWNGKDIQIDNSNGTIFTPRLGTGIKNNDNTFSGVLLGEWGSQSEQDGIIRGMTGIFGFKQGTTTYAFKDDGTAFIGSSGSGRIYFDGNGGHITSGNYNISSPTAGMLIDLDDGKIDMINSAGRITIDASDDNALFKITDSTNNVLINIGTHYYLQSSNYVSATSGTKLDLNSGLLETHNGIFHGTIYATAGEISGDVTIGGTLEASQLRGTLTGTNGVSLDFGTFKVSSQGVLSATGAYIGGTVSADTAYIKGFVSATSGYFDAVNIVGDITASKLLVKNGNYTVFDADASQSSVKIGGAIVNDSRFYSHDASLNSGYVGICFSTYASTSAANGTYAFYAGATSSTGNNANFLVNKDGYLYAKAGVFEGTLNSTAITTATIRASRRISTGRLETEVIGGLKTASITATGNMQFNISINNFDVNNNTVTIRVRSTTSADAGRQFYGTKEITLTPYWNNHAQPTQTCILDLSQITQVVTDNSHYRADYIFNIVGNNTPDLTPTTAFSINYTTANVPTYIGVSSNLRPITTNQYALGFTDSYWHFGFINNLGGNYNNQNQILIWSTLIPKDNNTDLGTDDNRWDLYARYILATQIGTTVVPVTSAYVTNMYVNGTQVHTSARDKKINITMLTNSQDILFDNLQPKLYQLKTELHQHKGFIVDEVCAAAAKAQLKPEDCGVFFSTDAKDPNDPNASLCYNDFIALNTWQIQLLKKRVSNLEEKIKELEDKLNEN